MVRLTCSRDLLVRAPLRGVTICASDPGLTPISAFCPLRLAKASVKSAPSDESPQRPHLPAAGPEVPVDRRPHAPPASSIAPSRPPGFGVRCPEPHRAAASPALVPGTAGSVTALGALALPSPADPAEHAQCASWNQALSGPGSVLRVFTAAEGALRRGGWKTVSALFSAPSLASGCGAHRKMRANQGSGVGLRPSRPPSGLIESYIKKFSSERGEGEGERGRGEAREGEQTRQERAP